MTAIDYEKIIRDFPWIVEKGRKYILSPDSDGFLCGLYVTNVLEGKICGWYDGKILIVKDGINPLDCIFVDVDINRNQIASIGHHMVKYNKRIAAVPNFNYDSCIQPNNILNYDAKNDFQNKYPFGTIHLLLSIYSSGGLIKSIPQSAIWPLLFTDGVWNNLFGYTENCLRWFSAMGIDSKDHILNELFCSNDMSFYEIMTGLNDFLRMRDTFNAKGLYYGTTYRPLGRNKRTGDKLKISNPAGEPINLEVAGHLFNIHNIEKARIEGFIQEMAKFIKMPYIADKWHWNGFKLLRFSKEIVSALNNTKYLSLMNRNPLSMAVTSGGEIEFTLENPDAIS